ncbi:MAG: MFS transporter [Acidimicrobiales bacterium]|nr:MFS transporter [Acidimicrobiales bacterium]HJL98814.1 MFS transporter [Acidimicrobiales bacterium]
MTDSVRRQGEREFIAFTALLTSAIALSIDMLLPAFADLRSAFGMEPTSNLPGLTITCIFVGMAIGMPIYGPLADTYGRIPVIRGGIALFALGALGSTLAPNLGFLLASRVLWGIGCAAPRTISQAMIRDKFEGDDMARVMAIVQTIFFAGPVLAPVLGDLLVRRGGSWRLTMLFGLVIAVVIWIWSFRIPESLDSANQRDLSFSGTKQGLRVVFENRTTIGYALTLLFSGGAFYSFLSSSELIISEIFKKPTWFVPYFSITMGVMAAVALTGSRVVGRIGARRLGHGALAFQMGVSLLMLTLALSTDGIPPVGLWMALMTAQIAAMVVMMPTMTTMALEPMGALAGTAASTIGFITLAIGALLGAIIDRQITSTVTPLAIGYALYTALAVIVILTMVRKDTSERLNPG